MLRGVLVQRRGGRLAGTRRQGKNELYDLDDFFGDKCRTCRVQKTDHRPEVELSCAPKTAHTHTHTHTNTNS